MDQYELWPGYTPVDMTVKPECQCGIKQVYPNAEAEQHSLYCPVFVQWKEKKDAADKLREKYKNATSN